MEHINSHLNTNTIRELNFAEIEQVGGAHSCSWGGLREAFDRGYTLGNNLAWEGGGAAAGAAFATAYALTCGFGGGGGVA